MTTTTDDLLCGTVKAFSAGGGNIFIEGDDGNVYFVPAVKFPAAPGSKFRGVQVGSKVTFKQGPSTGHRYRSAEIVEAHIDASYTIGQDSKPLPLSKGSKAHLFCGGHDKWFGADSSGNHLTFEVRCHSWKAYRTERPLQGIRIHDKTQMKGVILALDSNTKLPLGEEQTSGRGGDQVLPGTYVLWAWMSGRVVIQRLSRRSQWEGEGPAPRDKYVDGWIHYLVIEDRLHIELDPTLLMSGDTEAIAAAIPKNGLDLERDNDGFAKAIAEAGSYLQN